MNYKALLMDLDGTSIPFLGDRANHRVQEAVARAHRYVSVSIVTGRLLSQVLPVMEQLAITGPCVLNNGSQIYDPNTQCIIKELFLPSNSVEEIYQIIKNIVGEFVVYDGVAVYPAEKWSELSRVMSFYIPDTKSSIVEEIAMKMRAFSDVTTNKMNGKNITDESIEVVHGNATKQYGVYEIAKMLGISTHEIIGIGDGYNDFAMLMACGLKIAMGNAVPELKNIADFIAPPIEEDGVATVIEKFILNT